MTTYNTGNSLGSTSVKDLVDNTENLDTAVNNRSTDVWIDRLGNERLTWEGMTRLSNLGAAVEAAERAEDAATTAVAANRTIFRATKVELLAAMQGPPVQEEETPGQVTNDPGDSPENPVNGNYVWRSGTLIYSDVQPVNAEAINSLDNQLNDVSVSAGSPKKTYWEFHNTYPPNPALAGRAKLFATKARKVYGSIKKSGEWELNGVGASSGSGNFKLDSLTQILVEILFGQSLSLGVNSLPLASLSQPFSNITFGAGPKSTKAGSTGINPGTDTTKPLVEDENTGDTVNVNGPRGETPCSGSANYASLLLSREGINPSELVLFGSSAGHGAYTIIQLNVQSAWMQVWRDHVTEATARAAELGKSAVITHLPWIQGETKAEQTWQEYAQMLIEIYWYQVAFVKQATGQVWTPPMAMTQTYGVADLTPPATAQLWLARTYPENFKIIAPTYCFPHADDNVHLTNVGSKLLGCYFGRFRAYLASNRPWVNYVTPGIPELVSPTVIRIPHISGYPLQLLGDTPQHGYAVFLSGVDNPVTSVSVGGVPNRDVFLEVANPIMDIAASRVRYARDFKPAGITQDGGMGGLCDTSPDEVVINGASYPLLNYCPNYFETPITSVI